MFSQTFGVIPPTSLLLQLTAAALWVGAVLLLAETLNHLTQINPEVVRKIVHIGVGNVILLAWWLQIPAWLGIAASGLFSLLTLLSYRYQILLSLSGVGRQSWGTFFYAVSIGVLIASFWSQGWPEYTVLGVLVMTWGDGLAALVGQRWGRHAYVAWGIHKSWEGSATMALASFLVTSLLLYAVQGNVWQTWGVAIAVALVATGLEACSKFGIDNLTVPLGSAALGFGLNQLWWGG